MANELTFGVAGLVHTVQSQRQVLISKRGEKGVKNCQILREIQGNCGPGRKYGQGNENRESPGKIGRVG